jgi:hypothetical protein
VAFLERLADTLRSGARVAATAARDPTSGEDGIPAPMLRIDP